jgi:flagellar motor protein MotB
VDRPAIGGVGGTETILRSDLKKLKRSRLKAWFYLIVVLGLAGAGGYYGFQHFQRLVQQTDASRARESATSRELEQLRRVHNETVNKVGSGLAGAAVGQGAKPAGPTSAASVRLADDLKRVLGNTPQVAVETRGNQVVVSVDGAALFSGKEVEVGLGGYRTLYKFGKSLKTVKDRRVAITVPSIEIKKAKAWNLAAARAVSLGRFFTDDLGFERGRVAVSAPAPRAAGKIVSKSGVIGRVEFVLEAI